MSLLVLPFSFSWAPSRGRVFHRKMGNQPSRSNRFCGRKHAIGQFLAVLSSSFQSWWLSAARCAPGCPFSSFSSSFDPPICRRGPVVTDSVEPKMKLSASFHNEVQGPVYPPHSMQLSTDRKYGRIRD